MEDRVGKSVQQNIIFNTVGSLVYYICQWLMSIIIVRISGYEAGGIWALAMSVTAAPAIVAMFNVRSYQVSDVNEQYSDKTYIRSRMYTNLLAYLVCVVMIFAYGYSWYKSGIILVFMLFKVIEGFADVYYGIEQKWNRMDYVGISLAVRGVGSIIIFIVVLLITKNLLICTIGMCLFSVLVILLYDRRIVNKRSKGRSNETVSTEGKYVVWSLLLTCIPLAIVAFLNNLSINIPRIYLEKEYGSAIMGYYSSVASPTLVVQLAATTIFAPLVPILATEYNNKNKKNFIEILMKFGAGVIGLSIVALIGSKLLARWGLVLLFGKGIEPYVYLFVPIVIISILIAINASLFSICTLQRSIKSQYIIGIVGVISAWLFSITVVKSYSMEGVIYSLGGIILIQILIQIILIVNKIRKM